MKIGIMGIGAIGGYISAMLCKHNENVYIIGKGETLNIITPFQISSMNRTIFIG